MYSYQKVGLDKILEDGVPKVLNYPTRSGKTLIALKTIESIGTPSLYICPSNIISTLITEINKFYSSVINYEVYHSNYQKKMSLFKMNPNTHIVITTPDIISKQEDGSFLFNLNWRCIIFDEAQGYIEPHTKRCLKCSRLNSNFRLITSATIYPLSKVSHQQGINLLMRGQPKVITLNDKETGVVLNKQNIVVSLSNENQSNYEYLFNQMLTNKTNESYNELISFILFNSDRVDKIIRLIKQHVKDSIILFSHNDMFLRYLSNKLSTINIPHIYLTNTKNLKQCNLLLTSYKTSGIGINLSFANIVIFCDKWGSSDYINQSGSRIIDRHNPHKMCTFYNISTDTKVEKILEVYGNKAKSKKLILRL